MSKRISAAITTIIFAFIICFLSTKIYQKAIHRNEINKKIKKLQSVELTSLNGASYSLPDNDRSLIIILFNSTCDHCIAETKEFIKNSYAFRNADIVMISSEPVHTIATFCDSYALSSYPNLAVVRIDESILYEAFGTVVFPEILIYNRDAVLVRRFKGETKIDSIINYI